MKVLAELYCIIVVGHLSKKIIVVGHQQIIDQLK